MLASTDRESAVRPGFPAIGPWPPATRPSSATRLRVTEIRLTRYTLFHLSCVVLTGRHHATLLADGPVTDVPIAGHSIAGRRGDVNGPEDHLGDVLCVLFVPLVRWVQVVRVDYRVENWRHSRYGERRQRLNSNRLDSRTDGLGALLGVCLPRAAGGGRRVSTPEAVLAGVRDNI